MVKVVVTGLGVKSAIGTTLAESWKNILSAEKVVSSVPLEWLNYSELHSKVWSPLNDRSFSNGHTNRLDRVQHDPVTLLAVSATEEALASADIVKEVVDRRHSKFLLTGINDCRGGVIVGTGIGGAQTFLANHAHQVLSRQTKQLNEITSSAPKEVQSGVQQLLKNWPYPARVNPYAVSMTMPNAVSPALGIRYGLKGINSAVNAACSSSTIAVGRAYEAIRDGQQDLMLTGGSESLYDPYGALFRGFDCAGTLAHGDGDPKTLNRPFDRKRSGFLFSEGGAAMLVMESLEHARARGAPIIAEVIGFAQSFDAHSMMAMEPGGASIVRMLNEVCEQAGVTPADVSYINAHGTGTELNDKVECEVIEHVFGKRVLVNSTKSLVGHLLGASGALEIAVTAMSVKEGRTHPCANLDEPIADLNFATSSEQRDLPIGLSQSFAFGGNNACVMLKRFDDSA